MFKLDLTFSLISAYALILLGFLLILYVCADVNYFLRTVGTIFYASYVQPRIKVSETTELQGICTTQDVDFLLSHMNNARYIREADFGRFHFFARTGILQELRNSNGNVLQGALTIRYRRPIPIFSIFVLKTRVVTWDEKNLYFEQQFCSMDGFVKATMYSQNKMINLNIPEIMSKLLEKDISYRPEMPEDLKLWVSSLDASSQRLRKKD